MMRRVMHDRALRVMWKTGLPRYTQLIVMRGRVRLVPNRDPNKTMQTELWGSGVFIDIYWFAEAIPPGIRDGCMATIVGNLHTFNLNDHVAVKNCMHIPHNGAKMGKAIRETIAKYAMAPAQYVPESEMDAITDKIMGRTKKKPPAS